jgi:predicted transcriptional regulator
MSAVGKCFAHLGAGLAPVLFNRLIEMGWIEPQGGKRTVFDVTEKGSKGLKEVFDIHASELDA